VPAPRRGSTLSSAERLGVEAPEMPDGSGETS
jgi:hypothetical protein